MRLSSEARLIARGFVILGFTAILFAAGKVAFWQSEVVHEERTSIHRTFPGGIYVRFPQEALNAADLLTGTFLVTGGAIALGLAFAMGERLRTGRAMRPGDARSVRAFFTLAGTGLIWLGVDEVFLIHELISANFYIHDAYILAAYAAAGGAIAIGYQRTLRTSGWGLVIAALGAVLHGTALGLDFIQDSIGWAPEEPIEMLAAGLYALSMGVYATRLVLVDAPAVQPSRALATSIILELPDSAIEPIYYPPPAQRQPEPIAAPTPAPPRYPGTSVPSDPAWIH